MDSVNLSALKSIPSMQYPLSSWNVILTYCPSLPTRDAFFIPKPLCPNKGFSLSFPNGSRSESWLTNVVVIYDMGIGTSSLTVGVSCSCVRCCFLFNAILKSSSLSGKTESPAASSCPPNFSIYSPHSTSASNIWYPSIDLPEPFLSPFSELVITIVGL